MNKRTKQWIGALVLGIGPCFAISAIFVVSFEVYRGPLAKGFLIGVASAGLFAALGVGFLLTQLGVLWTTDRKRGQDEETRRKG